MPCIFCAAFGHYEGQLARRLGSDSFTLSEESAHLLVYMAAQVRHIARTTVRQVDNEVVPTMLCDLFEGLAEGLMEELAHKLVSPCPRNSPPPTTPAKPTPPNGERNARQAG